MITVPDSLRDRIENTFNYAFFPWFYSDSIAYDSRNEQFLKDFQFYHLFYKDGSVYSDKYEMVYHLIYLFESYTANKVAKVLRCKANLTLNAEFNDFELANTIHQDSDNPKCCTLLYYVNDSDGDTVIYNNDKSEVLFSHSPQKGKMVWFNPNLPHRATPPIKHKKRMVINFVLELENEINWSK